MQVTVEKVRDFGKDTTQNVLTVQNSAQKLVLLLVLRLSGKMLSRTLQNFLAAVNGAVSNLKKISSTYSDTFTITLLTQISQRHVVKIKLN
jgi:hypothetical protein